MSPDATPERDAAEQEARLARHLGSRSTQRRA